MDNIPIANQSVLELFFELPFATEFEFNEYTGWEIVDWSDWTAFQPLPANHNFHTVHFDFGLHFNGPFGAFHWDEPLVVEPPRPRHRDAYRSQRDYVWQYQPSAWIRTPRTNKKFRHEFLYH